MRALSPRCATGASIAARCGTALEFFRGVWGRLRRLPRSLAALDGRTRGSQTREVNEEARKVNDVKDVDSTFAVMRERDQGMGEAVAAKLRRYKNSTGKENRGTSSLNAWLVRQSLLDRSQRLSSLELPPLQRLVRQNLLVIRGRCRDASSYARIEPTLGTRVCFRGPTSRLPSRRRVLSDIRRARVCLGGILITTGWSTCGTLYARTSG